MLNAAKTKLTSLLNPSKDTPDDDLIHFIKTLPLDIIVGHLYPGIILLHGVTLLHIAALEAHSPLGMYALITLTERGVEPSPSVLHTLLRSAAKDWWHSRTIILTGIKALLKAGIIVDDQTFTLIKELIDSNRDNNSYNIIAEMLVLLLAARINQASCSEEFLSEQYELLGIERFNLLINKAIRHDKGDLLMSLLDYGEKRIRIVIPVFDIIEHQAFNALKAISSHIDIIPLIPTVLLLELARLWPEYMKDKISPQLYQFVTAGEIPLGLTNDEAKASVLYTIKNGLDKQLDDLRSCYPGLFDHAFMEQCLTAACVHYHFNIIVYLLKFITGRINMELSRMLLTCLNEAGKRVAGDSAFERNGRAVLLQMLNDRLGDQFKFALEPAHPLDRTLFRMIGLIAAEYGWEDVIEAIIVRRPTAFTEDESLVCSVSDRPIDPITGHKGFVLTVAAEYGHFHLLDRLFRLSNTNVKRASLFDLDNILAAKILISLGFANNPSFIERPHLYLKTKQKALILATVPEHDRPSDNAALYDAASANAVETVRDLLSHSRFSSVPDIILSIAVARGHIAMVELLLSHTACTHFKDRSILVQQLRYATYLNNDAMVQVLLNHDPKSGTYWNSLNHLLEDAIDRPKVLEVLLKAGACPDHLVVNFQPLLHFAVLKNCHESVALLLQYGANIDAIDMNGKTAYELRPLSVKIETIFEKEMGWQRRKYACLSWKTAHPSAEPAANAGAGVAR